MSRGALRSAWHGGFQSTCWLVTARAAPHLKLTENMSDSCFENIFSVNFERCSSGQSSERQATPPFRSPYTSPYRTSLRKYLALKVD